MPRIGSGKLEVTLPSDKEILLKRTFNAPRHLVFEAMTKPEHVRRWWCMEGCTMEVCDIDLRVGGAWRYVMKAPDGNVIAFRGVYSEISPPERLVHTEIFEPFPEEITVCTVTLVEKGSQTQYSCHVLHKTTMGRDMHVGSGMQNGADIALDQLEEIARTLR
ncbi:MAG: SRPBCC family protein [Kofleriaceae bacterium]|nr:SRPBCC family protein [Kofleriaceae bacterium]